jgi:hypothetical protein
LAARLTELRCECGSKDCAAAQRPSGTNVVVHVVAEQPTVDGSGTTPGYLPGYGSLPAPMVHDLSGTAKCKPLSIPDPGAPAGSGYRPSAALAEFVRVRDLTCRFPGCDRPAEVCDVDHTVPYPAGPTHPSNLKLLCRAHHLLKTFWTGVGGWGDRQLSDGTVVWTSPSGRTYTTKPGGALFFPQLASSTGEIAARTLITDPVKDRGVMMPRRKRTRQQDRKDRVAAERRINAERIADERRRREEWLAATYEPPPF